MGIESEPARLRRGDADAFDALLTRYQNRLYRYLLRLTADPAAAQDLFQETWLKVITRIHQYDESRPFEPWLFRVARNLTLDHLRKARQRASTSLPTRAASGGSRGLARKGPGRSSGSSSTKGGASWNAMSRRFPRCTGKPSLCASSRSWSREVRRGGDTIGQTLRG